MSDTTTTIARGRSDSWNAHLHLRKRHKAALEELAEREEVSISAAARRALTAGLAALSRDKEGD